MSDKKVATAPKTDDVMTGHTNGTNGDDGFVEINTDRCIYKPGECAAKPLQGYLLAHLAMPETDTGPWSAFLFRTTAPTLGLNFEDEVKEVPIGDEILIPCTAKLRQGIERFASHPDVMVEFRIQPLKQVKLPGGRKMWTYRVQGNKRTLRPRAGMDRMVLPPPEHKPKQLVSRDTNEADELAF